MNWYRNIQASPALYEPKRIAPNAKQSGAAIRFFNFLKSQNIKLTTYHGTCEKFWKLAQQGGYLIAPESGLGKSQDNEERREYGRLEGDEDNPHNWGNKQIFLSTQKEYAEEYAETTGIKQADIGVVLTIGIPLYAVAEVQAALFDQTQKIYNENHLQNRIKKAIEANNINSADKVTFILDAINKKYGVKSYPMNELTSYNALPIKWVNNVEQYGISADIKKKNNPLNQTPKKPAPPIGKKPSWFSGWFSNKVNTPSTVPPQQLSADETPF